MKRVQILVHFMSRNKLENLMMIIVIGDVIFVADRVNDPASLSAQRQVMELTCILTLTHE